MSDYQEWLKYAKSNYHYSITPVNDNVLFHDLCNQAQQAIEKSLKALLIYYGVTPEHTHNISKLLKEIKKYTDIDEDIYDAEYLTTFAMESRYPGCFDEVSEREYSVAVEIAKKCIDWVESKIYNN